MYSNNRTLNVALWWNSNTATFDVAVTDHDSNDGTVMTFCFADLSQANSFACTLADHFDGDVVVRMGGVA